MSNKQTVKDVVADKLMTMPQAMAKIDELTKTVSEKDSEISDNRKSIETYSDTMAKAEQAHNDKLAALTAEFEGKLQAQKTEFEGKIEALTKQVKETETSVNAKVANELKTIGVSESEIKDVSTKGQPMTKAQALEQYSKLSINEQRAFYLQHKAILNQ